MTYHRICFVSCVTFVFACASDATSNTDGDASAPDGAQNDASAYDAGQKDTGTTGDANTDASADANSDDASCSAGDSGTDFSCAQTTCNSASEYCSNGSGSLPTCKPYDCACEPTPTCQCLLTHTKCSGVPKCTGTLAAGFTVTCN
jgi:hypothetical protein